MSAELERRYARLLGLYPAEYRRARGAELLETLMASAGDRTRPAPREITALVVGGLRAHAGRHHRHSVRHSWWAAFRAAALMLLVYGTAAAAVRLLVLVTAGLGSTWPPAHRVGYLVAVTVAVFAVIAALTGRYRTAMAAATVAFVVSLVLSGPMHGPLVDLWQFPLAVALLVPVSVRPPAPVTGLLGYAPAVPLLLVLATEGLSQALPDIAGIVREGLLFGVFIGGLLWLAVDERVAMALGLLLLNTLLVQLGAIAAGGAPDLAVAAAGVLITAFAPATLLLASATTARRQARL